MLYAYSHSCVENVVVLYRPAKRVYLMLCYNPNTKEITKGQWLKHTNILHNECTLKLDGTFTYITLNYSNVPSRHNEKGCGYRCTCTPPLFTANFQTSSDFKWFRDRWESASHNDYGNMMPLGAELEKYIREYCEKQTVTSVPRNTILKSAPYIKRKASLPDSDSS
jgi:hypothetical protein